MNNQAGTDVPLSIHGVSFISAILAQVEVVRLKFLSKTAAISFSSSSETLQSFQFTLSGKSRREGLATTSLQEHVIYQTFLCHIF